MSTPHYINENHKVIVEKVNTASIDEAQKMYYRQLLDKSKESTNGRTQEEKTQDLTECMAGVIHLLITRHIDSKSSDELFKTEINDIKTDLDTLQEELRLNNEVTFK